ncbi:hypothetical protein PHA51_00555 [Rodentibacter pneumotropicus]|uniref:hypothetical protein n=1 Tax=Rodentibacter pneumotropicus TaxID=758 RepID=UPI00232FB5F3|nr:hypothetical protein [Rodentibacter pneumotropicus]MDC2824528.1 hypothetical protein [Rodentibacter pneumotropicus]
MIDKIMEFFIEKFVNNGNYTGVFVLIGAVIVLSGIKYLYKRKHGIDDISLKKAEVKFTDLERIEKILNKLGQSKDSLFRHKAYEILFNKSIQYIEIEYLDLIMKYKDQIKAFNCLKSAYFYIDKNVKDEIKEKRYIIKNRAISWISNLKPNWVYIIGYFIFAIGAALILSISPAYLYKEFPKNTDAIDWWVLFISYGIASIPSILIFCIGKAMLDKSLAVSNLKWLSDKNNLNPIKPQEKPDSLNDIEQDKSESFLDEDRLSFIAQVKSKINNILKIRTI